MKGIGRTAGDLAVVGQDPRFGGGGLAQMEAFIAAASALGRAPRLFHLEHPSLKGSSEKTTIANRCPLRSFGNVDAVNQLSTLRVSRTLRAWRSLWVVATAASFGLSAARSGRPYAAWLGTSLDDEWGAREQGLPATRRVALAVNRPVLRRAERVVLRRAAAVYATSPYSRELLARAGGLSEAAIGILPIPVDIDRFKPDPGAQALDPARPTILFVGRANDPRKNAGELIAAFRAVRGSVPGATLRLVGDPPRGTLEPGVEIAGVVPDVAGELRRAAVLVLPSLQEGFGVVVAEALAAGVPVVSTPCGGPEHLLHASGGGIVAQGFSSSDIAKALCGALLDGDALTEMGRLGRAYVEREHAPSVFRSALADALAALDMTA